MTSETASEVTQSCPTLCDPKDCSSPGSSIHGIFQARILEWVAISFSRGSSWPRDHTQFSRTAGRRFNLWATREAHDKPTGNIILDGEKLKAFALRSGARQECTLLPVLFNKVSAVLATVIREEKRKEIHRGKEVKSSVFVDDVTLYIENPKEANLEEKLCQT